MEEMAVAKRYSISFRSLLIALHRSQKLVAVKLAVPSACNCTDVREATRRSIDSSENLQHALSLALDSVDG